MLVLASLASCAIANPDRRLLLNQLDEHVAPSSETGRWLAAPIALPVGLVAGAADAVVVHPLSQLDDAWWDTADLLWEFDHDSNFRTVLLTPLSALATPVVFGVDWVFRSVFDIDDHDYADDDYANDDEPVGDRAGDESGGQSGEAREGTR
ncbi:MAG: hypothetical protein ACE37K_11020 [Planctomycetota bacterium]